MSSKWLSGTNAEVIELMVGKHAPATRHPLGELAVPDGATVGGVIRGSESFIAVGDTVIEPYDRVAVFALPEAVKEVDRFFK